MSRILLLPIVISFLALLTACPPAQTGCNAAADCAPLQCDIITGTCVECLSNEECADGDAFCCNGTCQPDTEIEALCGCSADPLGATGEACGGETPICQEQGARVGVLNIDQGVCGCPCGAADGGTLCEIDDEAEAGFICKCARNDPVGTCEAPQLDEDNFPHKVADTCSASEACVCLTDNAICTAPRLDCTSGGCVNLKTDVVNCGIPERDCTNVDTGTGLLGTCENGGCTCDAPTDCQGAGLNVDDCQFVGNTQQCVCDDYEVDGNAAPCPMELECVTGGCQVDGSVFGDEDELLSALGVAGQSE